MAVMMGAIVTNAYYRNDDRAFGFGVAGQHFPIQAMNFIRSEGLPEPVLNNLGDGGYLIFEGGPGSVYADGRLEVYGGEHVERAIRLFQTGEGLDEVVAQYGIETILLRHYSDQGLLNVLEADSSWRPVYYDSQYVVYLGERGETAELVERLAIDWQNPEPVMARPLPEWVPRPLLSDIFPSVARNREQLLLGELFLYVGNLDEALAYFDEAMALAPVNETVHFYRGVIFRAKGEEGQAADIFAMLNENFLKQEAAHSFAGKIYSEAGNNRAALAAYRQAVELGGRTEGNYREVIRLALLQEDYLAAVTALLELAQLRPEDAGIWNELGLIYVEVGDLERARRAFEQALVVDSGYEAARVNLEGLGGNNE
jgi:Flp pilus assembly protein TadD